MSRTLNFVDRDGQRIMGITFASEIKFDGNCAVLPKPRDQQTESVLRQGITLMNQNQADITIDDQRVTYLFQ